MTEADNIQQQVPDISLPIKWNVPDNIESRYANNVIVQPGQNEITIFFFETKVPPFLGSPEEYRNFMLEQGFIQAECVGKLVVNPTLMPGIIQAMQVSMTNYQQSSEERKNK